MLCNGVLAVTLGNPVLFLITALSGILAALLISMSTRFEGLTSIGRDSD